MDHVLTGSEVARRVGLGSRDAVHHYERLGIAKPIRDSANRRLYSMSDVQAIQEYRMRRGR